jgi:hypothetical protein
LQGFVDGRGAEHLGHGLDARAAVLHLPFIVGLKQDGADQANNMSAAY